jgi:hypothetical protein
VSIELVLGAITLGGQVYLVGIWLALARWARGYPLRTKTVVIICVLIDTLAVALGVSLAMIDRSMIGLRLICPFLFMATWVILVVSLPIHAYWVLRNAPWIVMRGLSLLTGRANPGGADPAATGNGDRD